MAAGLQLYEWTKSAKQPWSDVIMLPLPLFHVYANVGVQPLAFVGPNPLSLIPNPRDINDLLKTIRQVKPRFFNGVPTMYNAMLNHPNVRAGKVDLSSIKLCICGASALLAETRRQFEEKTGAVMLEGYSLTEAMMACCINPVHGQNKIGSIGMPLPDVDARIVDVENPAQGMTTGEVGELIMRAPQLMLEYWNNPLETAETLRIRVAEKHGVRVQEDHSHDAFERYWELTNETTRRQKFYAHTKKYHELQWEVFNQQRTKKTGHRPEDDQPLAEKIDALTSHLLTARYEGKILTTMLFFVFKDTLYYPYGASSGEARNTMHSVLTMWEGIKFGKKLGLKKFDMWGSLSENPDQSDPWYGFHRFKQGYGPELVEFVGSYDLVLNSLAYQGYKVADKLRWMYLKLEKQCHCERSEAITYDTSL